MTHNAENVRCHYPRHRYSHCDCPWWRRFWWKGAYRQVSGTIVMPKVELPEGFVPQSAAVISPQPDDLITLPDGSYFFHEEGWTVQRDIKGRGWKVTRIDG